MKKPIRRSGRVRRSWQSWPESVVSSKEDVMLRDTVRLPCRTLEGLVEEKGTRLAVRAVGMERLVYGIESGERCSHFAVPAEKARIVSELYLSAGYFRRALKIIFPNGRRGAYRLGKYPGSRIFRLGSRYFIEEMQDLQIKIEKELLKLYDGLEGDIHSRGKLIISSLAQNNRQKLRRATHDGRDWWRGGRMRVEVDPVKLAGMRFKEDLEMASYLVDFLAGKGQIARARRLLSATLTTLDALDGDEGYDLGYLVNYAHDPGSMRDVNGEYARQDPLGLSAVLEKHGRFVNAAHLARKEKQYLRAMRLYAKGKDFPYAGNTAVKMGRFKDAVSYYISAAEQPGMKNQKYFLGRARSFATTHGYIEEAIRILLLQNENEEALKTAKENGFPKKAIEILSQEGRYLEAARVAEQHDLILDAIGLYARHNQIEEPALKAVLDVCSEQDALHCAKTDANGYVITGLISTSGSSGIVFKARPDGLETPRAIKIITKGDAISSREAQYLDKISGRNFEHVVRVEQAGRHIATYDGEPVHAIVMEYVDGNTLEELIQSGSLASEQVMDYGMQLLKGIISLQMYGIWHRDLNKRNIKVNSEGILKILDFGIATDEKSPLAKDNTRTGPSSKSPASDIFSLGMLMYEMSTGEHLLYVKGEDMGSSTHKDFVTEAKESMYLDGQLREEYAQKFSRIPRLLRSAVGICLEDQTIPIEKVWVRFEHTAQRCGLIKDAGGKIDAI